MIALDTNVLVRLIVEDDPKQTALAQELVAHARAAGESLLLTIPVLCELVWVLSYTFRLSRGRIVALLVAFLADDAVVIDDRDAVLAAVRAYQKGRAGFADYLIGATARARGARVTFSFDQTLRHDPDFAVLR